MSLPVACDGCFFLPEHRSRPRVETVFSERFHDEVSRTFAHSPEPVEIEFSPIPGLAAFQLQSVRIPVELPVSGYRFPIPLRR